MLHEVDLPDAVHVTSADPNLFVLPAGLWDRNVVQELAKTGITSIFERLRDEFDFVIVDSHPVLAATDSLVIGQYVDAVLVSLMRDVSQMHNVHTAYQQLTALGIRVFGAVVSGMPAKSFSKASENAPVAA
jgi:polysaccharide biosynthesis transport protein